MAEEDIKSDIIESKEGSEVSEPEPENESREESKETDGDEPKENDADESKENDADESKENDGDESKENEGGDDSKENISDLEKTPKKTVPLYDQPLTQSGKRMRAKVEQFKVVPKEEHKYEFNGSGVALGEIPFIEDMINKELADDLKKLHNICFGRPGDRYSVKKHLKQFNGYPFDRDDKKFAAKKISMERMKNTDLKQMCLVLGLERSGLRADLQERVLDFVLKPEDQGKKVPAKKKRKSKSGSKKTDGGKKRKSKGGDEENDNTADDSTADDADDTADSSGSGSGSDASDSEPEEKPKKTPAKKPRKTPAKKVAKKTPAKKTPAKKTPAKKTPKRSKSDVDSESDSSDDEPLIKKTKSPPNNDEIKKKVEKILDGADLEEVTMKSVCKQIYEMYPGFDLTDRKSFIKDTVKSVLG